MIFSPIYRENKSIVDNCWLHWYFNFEEIIQRISRMVEELLIYNPLIDRNEAIKILKRDNPETLKIFAISDLRRYISTK